MLIRYVTNRVEEAVLTEPQDVFVEFKVHDVRIDLRAQEVETR